MKNKIYNKNVQNTHEKTNMLLVYKKERLNRTSFCFSDIDNEIDEEDLELLPRVLAPQIRSDKYSSL